MPQTIWTATSWVLFALAFAWPAIALAQRVRLARRRRLGVCTNCGYDLRASVSERCAECGCEGERYVPLIRFRRAAAGLVFMLMCFSASHLANRVEAIRARGWIAAAPTTVLIPYALHIGQPGEYRASAAANELVECRATTPKWNKRFAPFGRAYSSPEIDMARWQWWWAIERSLDFDLAMGPERTVASGTAEGILTRALWEGTATPAQRDRILRKVKVSIETRAQWPAGSEIRIRLSTVYCGSMLMDFALEPVEPDTGLGSLEEDIAGRSIPVSWVDETTALGIAGRPGPVDYEISAFRWDDTTEQRLEVMRETRLVTTVVPADQVIMQAVPIDPDLLDQSPVSLEYRESSLSGKGRCTFCLYLSECPALVDAIGDSTFAIRIRLKKDGLLIGENTTWVSVRSLGSDGSPFLDGVVRMSFAVDAGSFATPASPVESPWSVEIEGDRDTALRDFESSSYWAGKYEFRNIRVERVEPGK